MTFIPTAPTRRLEKGTPAKREEAKIHSMQRQNLRDVIDIVLHSPMTDKELNQLDGTTPMSKLKGMNIDVQTAIVIKLAQQAVNGDVKSIDLLGKYGGLEPAKKLEADIAMPQFIDDIPSPSINDKIKIPDDDEDEEDSEELEIEDNASDISG